MTRLLLIDTRVRDYQKIMEAAAPSVICMTFDYDFDTLPAILARLPPGPFESVGIVQDGTYYMQEYKLVAAQRPADVSSESPDMSTWTDVREFLAGLKTQVVDFISCMLLANPGFATAMISLEAELGIDLRASRDMTGNLVAGGNWIQESDGVDIKGLYFTDAIDGYMHVMFTLFGAGNQAPFLNVKVDGSNADWCMVTPAKKVLTASTLFSPGGIPSRIIAWGPSSYGGTGAPSDTGYISITQNVAAFSAIKYDGSISSWGVTGLGGTGAPSGTGYTYIASTERAFAALKSDGAISSWGATAYGGTGAPSDTGYIAVIGNIAAFAALKNNGSISVWGDTGLGGSNAPSGTGYTAISSSRTGFSSLKNDGSVKVWGLTGAGHVPAPSDTGYIAITANAFAFAGLKNNGSISAWGDLGAGGSNAPTGIGYETITAAGSAFAALKTDGTIRAWGVSSFGGANAPTGTGFKGVASALFSFSAIKDDGSIRSWGSTGGGYSAAPLDNGYKFVIGTDSSYAAANNDGLIYSWGNTGAGATGAPTDTGYTMIAATNRSYAAINKNKGIRVWGDPLYGGTGAPTDTGYTAITATQRAFAAFIVSSDSGIQSITVNGDLVEAESTINLLSGITNVEITAIPTSQYASVTIEGNTSLQTGLNIVTITVTAEDRSTTIYYIYLLVAGCCPYTPRITETNEERTDHRVGNLLRQAIKDGRQPHMDASTWIRSRK